MPDTDEAVIEQFHDGKLSAFEILFQRYHSMVFNMALRMLGNFQEAEDIAQDIFIKAYKNLENFKGKSQFKTWLYKIASTTCIDAIRKKKSIWNFLSKLLENKSIDEEHKNHTEENGWVQEVLDTLPPHQRLLLVMRYMQGFSNKEIAEIENTTEGTIKVQIYRAREIFRKKSEKYLKEGDFDGM